MPDETGSTPPGTGPTPGGTAESGHGGSFVALRSGLTIRHYVIEEVIGAGGFGITYRARHDRLKSKVFALKEFFPRQFAARRGTHVVSTPDGGGLFRWGLDRFLKEAEALAKCEHPGIVDVVDYFEENGTAYAVLGYVEGQQMGQWLDSLGRPPTQAELDRVLMPLLDALEVVHGAKLLHRDIAPDNILIRRDGMPCLIDFGACREDIRERSQKVSAIVKHGYSPPEQYHGIAELQGPWTDIYAVGATLYRAISGHPPMDSSRRGALGDELKPVTQMTDTAYRPGFMAAIDMALRLKPGDRPKSIPEWRGMLTDTAPATSIETPQRLTDTSEGTLSKSSAPIATAGTAEFARSSADASSAPAGTAALRDTPLAATATLRRGPLLAGVAALALAAAGAFAYWRAPPPTPPAIATAPSPNSSSKRTERTDTAAASLPVATSDPAPIAPAPLTPSAPVISPSVPSPSVPSPSVPSPPAAPIAPAPSDPEQLAETAWSSLAGSTDIAAIERFLTEHAASRVAATARARLEALRSEQSRAEAASAAAAEAERQRIRDANWSACQSAADTEKAARCAPVITSDDIPARRAAAFHQQGLAERRLGNLDKAIADMTRALELAPADAQALTDRGIAHFLKGDAASQQAAMRDYDAAVRAAPRHAEALNNRAWSVFQAGRPADALADANRSIDANSANGYAYDTRGQILEALGRREDAIRDYERAIALDATQETSRAALARLRPRTR